MNISPGESLRTSFTAVWSNRLRSLLTILGIVIGITTVVTVSSLLTGVRGSIVAFFQQLGPDNIFVFKSTFGPDPPEGSPRANQRHRRPLRLLLAKRPGQHKTTARHCRRSPSPGGRWRRGWHQPRS